MGLGFAHGSERCADAAELGFRPRSVGVVAARRDFDLGIGTYPPRVALPARAPANKRLIGEQDRDFHTVRSGVDPEELDFRRTCKDAWKYF